MSFHRLIFFSKPDFRLWNGMSERTRRDYPRPKFEKRVKELTAYKGWLWIYKGSRIRPIG